MGAVLAVLAIGSVGALELSVESGDIKTPITVSWSGSPQRAFDWFAVYDTANFNENGGTLDGIGMGWTMHYVYADTPAFSTDGEVWAYAATLPGEATFSVDTPGEYYFVYFCCDAYEIVNATKITVTAPSYAIFSVVKNRLLPRIDVEVNLPLAPDMEPGGWGEPLKAEMLNKDMHATMADWIWVWGPDADYSSNDMLNAFHGSSDSPGYMSDAFQGMYANIVPFEQCWFYVGHGGETYEERYNIVQGQTVSCGPAYDTGYGAIQDSGIGYARFSIVVPSAGIYSVGVFSESFSEPWPKMYWRDVVFCGLDFAASANSVVAGAEFAIDVIRQQWVPGCGINANEENEMLTFNVYSLPTESESCDAICRDVVPAPVQQSLPIVKSELRWLALPESNLTVRLHRAAQYVLVVEDAPSATEFARFDLSVTPARAYARRTLATGLPTELRAGVSYTVSIDPYDVFGNAVVADDGDLLARLKVCPTEWLTGTERQPNGTYVITLTMSDAAAYARHDVRIQLREGAYAAGGSSRRLAHDRDDLPNDWDGVDVAGSPMAILVTDAQGRFSPEASEEGDDGGAATVAVAVGVTLAVLFAVALGWIYRRNRAAHNLLKLLKSQNSLPPTPSQLEALAASLGAQALPDALRRLQVGSDELALGRLLGSGAFAEVRLADWRGTPIAVKRLLRTRHTTEGLKAFKHEAALHASLRHPNIVGLLGFSVDMAGGMVCLLLELCGKGTLEHPARGAADATPGPAALGPRGAVPDGRVPATSATALLPARRAGTTRRERASAVHRRQLLRDEERSLNWGAHKLPIAIGVARAITYLHAQDPPVIHRDLKCANVLVDDGYNAKLCDFGLSRERHDEATMSTPLFSAPELLRRERYDEKARAHLLPRRAAAHPPEHAPSHPPRPTYAPPDTKGCRRAACASRAEHRASRAAPTWQVDVWSFGCLLESLATHRQTYALHEAPDEARTPRIAAGSLKPGLPGRACFIAPIIDWCTASSPVERPSFAELTDTLQSPDLHYLASVELPGPVIATSARAGPSRKGSGKMTLSMASIVPFDASDEDELQLGQSAGTQQAAGAHQGAAAPSVRTSPFRRAGILMPRSGKRTPPRNGKARMRPGSNPPARSGTDEPRGSTTVVPLSRLKTSTTPPRLPVARLPGTHTSQAIHTHTPASDKYRLKPGSAPN